MLGGEGSWNYEIGQGTEIDAVELRESNINPLFCRRDTKRAFQWRIRNLPYPISTYLLSIEDANTTIVLRTTNKKYYKRFTIPDLERLGVRLDSSLLSKTHSSNTLVISYMKPEIYLQYEKELKKELAKTKPISGGDVPCVSILIVFLFTLTHPAASSWWFPPNSATSEDQRQSFRTVNFPKLQERLLAQFTDQLQSKANGNSLDASHFQWTSVTMFRESKSSISWLIIAGTSPKQNHTGTAFIHNFGAVFGCQVDVIPSSPGGFDISTCEILGLDTGTPNSNHSDAGLLGKGLQSLQLPTGGVVVFCDPLWHSSQGTQSPGGMCSVLERINGAWWSVDTVKFCSSAGRTQPCAGGFSIDLRLSGDGTNAQLLAGFPYAQSTGRVRIVDGLLRHAQQHVYDIESKEVAFGASVAWSPHFSGHGDALAIVGSPSTSVQGFRASSLVEDFETEELKMTGDTFGGLGFSVDTSLVGAGMVVFAGAPFEEVEKVGPNTGRMYAQFRNTDGVYNFSLEGSRPDEMFGYAIARIGDIDGDGIGEVAISAPAIGAENVTGRVYIHRVLPNFRLESDPLQILEAPPHVVGFGISLSRSIDIDSDGGPEMAVTTLDPKVPVLIYSLPRRLRAKCAFRAHPLVTSTSVRKGDLVTLKITINFIDPVNDKPFPAPASFQSRSHQINPDVLWLQRYDYLNGHPNQSDFLTELLLGRESFRLDPSQPRFTLEEISDTRVSDNGIVILKAKLLVQEDARYMDLDTVPLHVAFRSILADPQCNQYTRLCPKIAQPSIDWSDCIWKMPPPAYLCPPHPKCSADLQVSINGGGKSHIPVQFGRREDANQTMMFVLRNNGPTKSEGVRVLLRTIGWPKNASRPGLRILVNSVHLRDAATGAFLASNDRSTGRWSVSLPSNGAAALITAQQGTVLYPDQELTITVDIFLAGLAPKRYEEEGEIIEKGKEEDKHRLPSPGILANVSAAVGDPSGETNIATGIFDVIYKPQLRINPGAAPPALVDARKAPPHLSAATRIVLGNEVGPQLEHIFLVENFGSVDLHDIAFQLDIPVRTNEGDTLLYLADKARLLDGSTSGKLHPLLSCSYNFFTYSDPTVWRHWRLAVLTMWLYYAWVNTLPKMVSANGSEVGFCEIDDEFVNPLNLTIREAGSESKLPLYGYERLFLLEIIFKPLRFIRRCSSIWLIPLPPDLLLINYPESPHSSLPTSRRRRSVEEDKEALTPGRVTVIYPFGDNRADVYFKRSGQRQSTISCTVADSQSTDLRQSDLDFTVICARVTCHLNKLLRADTVRVSLTGWLWTPTFFKHQLPDVKFVSRLSLMDWGEPPQILRSYPSARLDFPDDPPAYELPQAVVFRGVTGKYLARIPLWPIIVGVVLGSILLFSLIASLYCCGFFRRRQRTKEARRKSMMAAAAVKGRPSAHATDNHPAAFLLDKGTNAKGVPSNRRNADIYSANPMHAGSPDLLYAPEPQPPTPPPPESPNGGNRDSEWMQEDPKMESVQETQEKVDQLETEQVSEVKNNDRDPRDRSPSSSSGLPDWLMSELKENEAKTKKSKSSKSNS
ncbi:Protein DPCD [Echinococcus granulosus]|uniref:Protein DPCD n=1 Tax=Echinococcus granulosus TaxID=6210 RepID=W6UIP7_ECHGR|nr:Protein DPCD [Echinococcus granulosus]EUB60996.1 Protein DPCD [Echinococcus granulosus]